MRHEESVDGPYNFPFPDSPRFEKTRRRRKPESAGIDFERSRTNKPSISIPLELKTSVATPNFELLKREFPDQTNFISLFVVAKGPQAVTKGVVYSEGNTQEGENIAKACGIAFERLAHLWLKNIVVSDREDVKMLDPGSTSRLFNSLRKHYPIDFTPDGAIVANFSSNPTLIGIYEYKMRPDRDKDRLKSQVERMKNFSSKFSGKQLMISTKLDKYQSTTNRRIGIDDHLPITLVLLAEESRNVDGIGNGIIMLSSPFVKKFVVEIVKASLKDFGDPARLPQALSF